MPWLSFNFNRETSALLLRGIYPAIECKSAATEPNGHEKWIYADESRIEFCLFFYPNFSNISHKSKQFKLQYNNNI
jgi:hypothetical protein